MEIILIRHAESEANLKLLYAGSQDSHLTEAGIDQASRLARHLAKTISHVSAVYSSPQSRALETAKSVVHDLFLGDVIVDDRLSEVNLGVWEGLSADEIEAKYPGQINIWNTDPETIQIPQGENLISATERIFSFFQEKFDDNPEGRIIVVSHGLIIRCLLTKLLIRPLRDIWFFDVDNAGYSIIDWQKVHSLVVKINETEHLVPRQELE